MPACTLALAGVSASFAAVPGVTDSVAVALLSPVVEAVMVALPIVVGVKLDFATPLVGDMGETGLNDPETPLAEKLIGFVAVVTVLP